MPLDPFAVNDYDPAVTAPAVETCGQDDAAFADLWLKSEAGRGQAVDPEDYLATHVLAAYDPGKWVIFDPGRLFAEGQTAVSGGLEDLARASVSVEPTEGEKLERRARLSLVIHLQSRKGEWPRGTIRRALVHALDLEAKIRKRDEAKRVAQVEGRLLAEGKSATAVVKETAAELGISQGRIWGLHRSPDYIARRDLARKCYGAGHDRFIAFARNHPADGWFAGETVEDQVAAADSVAAQMIVAMRESMRGRPKRGKRPVMPSHDLRWDVFNLVEGHAKRRLPLSATARLAVDHALGLFDADGMPVVSTLAGVRDRQSFIAAAGLEAREWKVDATVFARDLRKEMSLHNIPAPGDKQLRAWRKRNLYQMAVGHKRAAR